MRLALLLSHPIHDRNWLCSRMAETLRRRGHEVLPLIADRPRFRRLRQSLRLATMVAEEPRSQTYRHKATLLRGTRRLEAAYWRRVSRNGLDLVKAARRIEARLPVPSYIQEALRQTPPDLLLWPTLMHMDAVENDWIKVARTMGLPVLAAPASWDTLVSKGSWLLRPDRLIVWGEASRRHAIEMHGFAPGAVAAPGPPHFHPYEGGVLPLGKGVLVAGTSLNYWRDEAQIVEGLRWALPGVEVLHRPHPRTSGGWDPDVGAVRRALEPAACVVAAFSTVVIEGALLGRSAVLVGFGNGPQGRALDHANYTHMAEVARWVGPTARSVEQLHHTVCSLLGRRDSASTSLRAAALSIAHCTPGIQERIALAVEAAR